MEVKVSNVGPHAQHHHQAAQHGDGDQVELLVGEEGAVVHTGRAEQGAGQLRGDQDRGQGHHHAQHEDGQQRVPGGHEVVVVNIGVDWQEHLQLGTGQVDVEAEHGGVLHDLDDTADEWVSVYIQQHDGISDNVASNPYQDVPQSCQLKYVNCTVVSLVFHNQTYKEISIVQDGKQLNYK